MAGNGITMGQGATTISANGKLTLQASTGDITVETLNAGSADVAITATTGSVLDRNDSGAVDIFGAGVILTAGNGIGTLANPLETSVDTLTAAVGAGGVFVLESDGLTIDQIITTDAGSVQVSVAAGGLTLGAGGIHTGAGSVVLSALSSLSTVTLGGNITTDAGAITIRAAGALGLNALLTSQHGAVMLTAGTNAVFASGANISTDAAVRVRADGDLLMSDASVQADSGDILLSAGHMLVPGIAHTSGLARLVTDADGVLVFNRANDRLGENIDAITNHLDIQANLSSSGAVLTIAPLTPALGSKPADIVIGGKDSGNAGTSLSLTLEEIDRIQDGFTTIVLGNGQIDQAVVIQGLNDAVLPAAEAVVFKDPVVVDLSGTGGKLGVTGQVVGESLTVLGSGTVTGLVAADIRMSGSITVGGLLKVASASALTSTAGNLVLGAIAGLNGTADPAEVLSLSAHGGNLVVNGAVSDLDGLLVSAAVNVTFNDTVSITGDLTINATGAVTFMKALDLSGTGSLTVHGATSIVFENGATVHVKGDITLNAQGIVFAGGPGSVSGAGILAITSATASANVVVGAGVLTVPVSGALNLTGREFAAIGSGFGQVVIGQLTQGDVTVAGAVRVAADVILLSHGNLAVNASVDTVSSHSVALTSGAGNIAMATGTRIDSHGGDVLIQADNAGTVLLAIVDARSSTGSGAGAGSGTGGAVTVQAGKATVSDANHDSDVNIFATSLDLSGWGPSSAAAGDVLEAAAQVVRVSAASGLVVRESGADGRASFNVMSGGKLYQQLVVVGPVTRVTQDPAALVQKNDAAKRAAGLPATSALMTSENWASTHGINSTAGNLAVASYLGALFAADTLGLSANLIALNNALADSTDLLNDPSYGIADKLQRSYILGTPGAQPLISGLETFSQDNFEYWVDTLTV